MDNTEFFNLLITVREKRSKLSCMWKSPFEKALKKYFEATDPCDNAFVFGNVRCFYRQAYYYLHMTEGSMNAVNEWVVKLHVELTTSKYDDEYGHHTVSRPIEIKIPAMLIRYFTQEGFDKWVYSYWTIKRNKEKVSLAKLQKLVDKFPTEAKAEYESLKQEHRPS